jgi:hypothetical protein
LWLEVTRTEDLTMNLVEVSQHLCDNLLVLTDDNPTMEVVILIHSVNSDISMISNTTKESVTFEVLSRGMASCFDPQHKGIFNDMCHKYLDVIKPTVAALGNAESIVCFWDKKMRKSSLVSSLTDSSVVIAIICEHMIRTLTAPHFHEVHLDSSRVLH